MEIKYKLETIKIPTPQTFHVCPVCNEILKGMWEDSVQEYRFYCKNGECELDYLVTKK